MDFHQKTLLSDEFGIGFGGLLLERLFDAGHAIDISAALPNPGSVENVVQSGSAQPDYLMWGSALNSPYYVVECKGCQTSRDATMGQIRRGLEQVPSLIFGGGGRPVGITLVVASHMQASENHRLHHRPTRQPSPTRRILVNASRLENESKRILGGSTIQKNLRERLSQRTRRSS